MHELIARVSEAAGLDPSVAEKAIAQVLAFLAKEGPQEEINTLLDSIPAAQQWIADLGTAADGGSAFGGGGIMGLGQTLMAQGLSMDQIRTLGGELLAYGREKAGEDAMGPIVASIPGLSQFV